MISTIEERLVKTFGYFVEDRYPGTIIQEQKGVMRTNCLDCLDRTNVVQTKIAFRIVENILDRLKESNRKTTQASRVHVDDTSPAAFLEKPLYRITVIADAD